MIHKNDGDQKAVIITAAQLETLGLLADQAENAIAASHLAVSPHIHVTGMRHSLSNIEAVLKALHRALTGEDAWAEK